MVQPAAAGTSLTLQSSAVARGDRHTKPSSRECCLCCLPRPRAWCPLEMRGQRLGSPAAAAPLWDSICTGWASAGTRIQHPKVPTLCRGRLAGRCGREVANIRAWRLSVCLVSLCWSGSCPSGVEEAAPAPELLSHFCAPCSEGSSRARSGRCWARNS